MQRLVLTLALVATLAASPALAADAPTHKLTCPASAPAEWGPAKPPLDGVEVLSTAPNEPIDDTAPPSLVPDTNVIRKGTLYQTWRMDAEPTGWRHFVDCHYRGTKRLLRLPADGLHQCERTITHFRKSGGKTAQSVDMIVCD
jgi:hypothetical protein